MEQLLSLKFLYSQDQQWYWSKHWQTWEKQADEDIVTSRVYRFNNVVKHAQATQVEIEYHPNPKLTITDNGRGLDPTQISRKYIGLSVMQERAEAIGSKL